MTAKTKKIRSTLNLTTLLRLFRRGDLTTHTADWLHRQGYCLVCENGQAVAIIPDE